MSLDLVAWLPSTPSYSGFVSLDLVAWSWSGDVFLTRLKDMSEWPQIFFSALKTTNIFLSIKDQNQCLPTHCNYIWEIGQKWDLVLTFDWRFLLTQVQRVWTSFCKILSRIPHLAILGVLKYMPNYNKYGQICLKITRVWYPSIWQQKGWSISKTTYRDGIRRILTTPLFLWLFGWVYRL